jgi:copper chaperone
MQFHIENMTCGGCVRSVTKAIQELDPAAQISADTSTRRIDVQTTIPRATVASALADAGFVAN